MAYEHSGAGVLTIRFATDVETTATVRAFGEAGESAPAIPAQVSDTPATLHAVSIAAGAPGVAYRAEVRDAKDGVSTGTLEFTEVVSSQYFGRGANAPAVELLAGAKGVVRWKNLRPSPDRSMASVVVLAKQPNCTTAQACVGEVAATVSSDNTTADAAQESHELAIAFPGGASKDYEVIAVGRMPNGKDAAFYQVNVKGSELK